MGEGVAVCSLQFAAAVAGLESRRQELKNAYFCPKNIVAMTRIAVPLENALNERLLVQAAKLDMKPEELAAKAIRNILFLLEMKAMQSELKPLLEAKGIKNEDDLYAAVS